MQLFFDGSPIEAHAGESLLTLCGRLGLDSGKLSSRPLAAQMAGETFNLNYVPLRTDENGNEVPRRAVRLCKGQISLIRYNCDRGNRLYERSVLFLFLCAVRKVFPEANVHTDYSLGSGLHNTVLYSRPLTDDDVESIRAEMDALVGRNIPLIRKRMDIDEAIDYFAGKGQSDKVEMLGWRNFSYFDVYELDGNIDYFYGEMLPSTGFITGYGMNLLSGNEIILLKPTRNAPDLPCEFLPMPKFSAIMKQTNEFGQLMRCTDICTLNEAVRDGSIRSLIRINEALHEKCFAAIADDIIDRGAKAVLIAGPSSSGKTTSANRLCVQLRVHGKQPILMSLDNYYRDRDLCPLDENGEKDLEHIDAIDTALFREHLSAMLRGQTVRPPRFDFLTGKSVAGDTDISIGPDTIFVIEGIHGLNPTLMPDDIDRSLIYKMYVSALTTLNLDDHNRIPTTDIRLLRRIVRDYATRGASVADTLSMWASVRRGEERWIFPYQEEADVMFNSTLVYEPAVLKKQIFPLLLAERPSGRFYDEVRAIVKFLNYAFEADVDDEIPPTSIIREFIGGNTFYR